MQKGTPRVDQLASMPLTGSSRSPTLFSRVSSRYFDTSNRIPRGRESFSTLVTMPSTAETKYDTLPQNEAFFDNADEKGQATTQQLQRPQRRLPSIVLQAVVLFFALLGLVDTLRIAILQPWSSAQHSGHELVTLTASGFIQAPHQRSCRCGSTVEEDKANNCTYDSMAAAWLPSHCIDFELLREWEKAGNGPNGEWEYFADQHREKPLTLDEVAHLPQRVDVQNAFFVSMAWHVKVSSDFSKICLNGF